MQEIFHEVYGKYYRVLELVLEKAANAPITREEIENLIQEHAFQESVLEIVPKLISEEWALLKKEKDGWMAKQTPTGTLALTRLQQSWLKALLEDPRMSLFLEEWEKKELEANLQDVEPLYRKEDFCYFDRACDGDPYDEPAYRGIFAQVLKGLRSKEMLSIRFYNARGDMREGDYLPCRLEYSPRDDKFRLNCLHIVKGSLAEAVGLHLSCIQSVTNSSERLVLPDQWEKLFQRKRCSEPVVLEISEERNALERCLLHFASYEKRTEYDEARDRYRCCLWYDQEDEPDLLIQVLSFGPAVRVLGPKPFLDQVKNRVQKQYEFFYGEK